MEYLGWRGHPKYSLLPLPCGCRRARLLVLQPGLNQLPDLAVVGVAAQARLGENELAVDRHLEHAAFGRDQRNGFDLRLKCFEQFVRQTDGARRVMSNRAIGDGDVKHGRLPSQPSIARLACGHSCAGPRKCVIVFPVSKLAGRSRLDVRIQPRKVRAP